MFPSTAYKKDFTMRSTFINWLGARAIAFICLASSPYFLSLSLSHTLGSWPKKMCRGWLKVFCRDLACVLLLLPSASSFYRQFEQMTFLAQLCDSFLVYLNFNEIVAKWHTHERRVSLFGDAHVRVKLNFNSGSNLLTKLSPIEVEID